MFVATWYCYISIGVGTFISDKESYIREFLLNRVDTVAASIQSQIEKTLMLNQTLEDKHLSDVPKYSKTLNVKKMARMSLTHEGIFRLRDSYGDEDGTFLHVLDQFGWEPIQFQNQSLLIRKTDTNGIVVGNLVEDSSLYITSLDIKVKARDSMTSLQLDLIDPLGNSNWVLKPKEAKPISVQNADLLRFVLNENRSSGVARWISNHEAFLLGYKKLPYNELIVVGFLPEKDLVSVTQRILFKSSVLGIGILLLTAGLCILILGDITGALKTMTFIIEQYKSGSQGMRINTAGLGGDEIGSLAAMFNMMAEKIDDMMSSVAARVRAEYEGDARRLVEEKFLPLTPLETSHVQVAGKSLLSNEYSGDWWYRESVNGYVIVIVSKIEARGCLASTIATAAQAAVKAYVGRLMSSENEAPNLVQLAACLNEAVYGVTHGKKRMNCFLVQIDNQTGAMEMINAGSPAPYLHRPSLNAKSSNPSDRFKQLQGRQYTPLGIQSHVTLETDSVRLFPGDRIFWHTSGLLTVPNVQGQIWKMDQVHYSLLQCFEVYGEKTEKVADGLVVQAKEYFAIIMDSPPDDMSFIVATIPSRTRFKNKGEVA
jgi:hypothetical protein